MTPRPTTLRTCPTCGERLEPVRLGANHDRPAVTYLRCIPCGVEEGHEVETLPELEEA